MRTGLLALGVAVGVGACSGALAQQIPQVEAKRDATINATLDALYDSNIAHTNAALAAQRHITPEDETLRPSLAFSFVEPLGRNAVFLNGDGGYDFHKNNKQLDRENLAVTGGAMGVLGPCHATLFGRYTALQSDLGTIATQSVAKNTLGTQNEGLALSCGYGRGIQVQLAGQHVETSNSDSQANIASHRTDGGNLGIGYANESIGQISLIGSYSRTEFPTRVGAKGSPGSSYWDDMLGIQYGKNLGSKIHLQASAGRMELVRANAPVGVAKKITGLNYSFAGTYAMSQRLQLTAQASRAFQPSNTPGKLFELTTQVELNAQYKLGRRFDVTLGGVIDDTHSNTDTASTLLPVPTDSKKYIEYGSIRYIQSQRASLVLDLRHENRQTDLANFNYSDDRATLTLALNF